MGEIKIDIEKIAGKKMVRVLNVEGVDYKHNLPYQYLNKKPRILYDE